MSTHKHVDGICLALILAILAGALSLVFFAAPTTTDQGQTKAYETGLFDTAAVHTLDISIDDWDGFLETCENEEYVSCDVTIDGQTVSNVGLRAKGNTSLSQVAAYGNDRYSFKVEFDHYQDGGNYQGLDKLVLNNLIQDNTYMKDYLTYQMMARFGVDAPLCSYVFVTVNGEDWGLYLGVEAVEESFQERNYGNGSGQLYKPESMSGNGGGAPGAGGQGPDRQEGGTPPAPPEAGDRERPAQPFQEAVGEQTEPAAQSAETAQNVPEEQTGDQGSPDRLPPGRAGGMGAEDVKLLYTDEELDSYSNIFDHAVSDPTEQDKKRLIRSLKVLNEGTDVSSVVDVEEVMRYFVVHNFVCNGDSYTGQMVHNYYLYEEEGVLSMIPWDYNLAFGGFEAGGDAAGVVNMPIDTPVSGGSMEDRPMVAWLFQDEETTAQYHALFDQFLTEFLENGVVTEEIQRVTEMLAPYVERDPTKFCTEEAFQAGSAALAAFCTLRTESIRGQLAGTIPSTSDGQQAEGSTLVDASSLDLSAMGSMGFGRGGGPAGDAAAARSAGPGAGGTPPSGTPSPGGEPERGSSEGTEK